MKLNDLLNYMYFGTKLVIYENNTMSIQKPKFICELVWHGDDLNDCILNRSISGYYIEDNKFTIIIKKGEEL
mgnify:CR=1 FL=1